jgi:tRNA pseudouridine-54 N-methylase
MPVETSDHYDDLPGICRMPVLARITIGDVFYSREISSHSQ